MERFELHIEAESRIRWKVYVRFGGEFSKTDHSNMARRRLLSLHYGAREAEEDRMGKHQSLRIRNEKDKTEVVVDFSERTVNIGGWESKRQINYRHLKLGELGRYGLTEAGTKVLLGKTCRVYKQNTWLKSYMVTVTHYVWEGINLKSDLKYDEVPGWEEREEVKSIQVNVDVPQEKFQIPRGFKVKDWRGR